MSTRSRPRAFTAVALALVAALALAGCGGGGLYFDEPFGTLEVHNSAASFEDIDGVDVYDPFGPYGEYFALFLFPGETDWIDLFPGTYDVDVYWSDGFVETVFDVDIFDGALTSITGVY